MWTLEEGLVLIRTIQPLMRGRKWHVALGGGVLTNGLSAKDIDLYVMPFDNEVNDDIVPTLCELWGDATRMRSYPPQACYESKWMFTVDEKRIDVFIGLRGGPERKTDAV